MKYRITIVVLLLSILFTACSAPVPAVSSANLPTEITFGAVHDLSGATASYGNSIKKGIDLAVKQINTQKFLGAGTTINMLYEDTAGDPNKANAAFKLFTANPKVVVILGPTLSNEAKSADLIAQEAKVPVIASSNTVVGIVEIGDYIFRTSLPESSVIPNTINVVTKALNLKNVAIIYGSDDAYTKSGYDVFKATLSKAGIEILTEESFLKGDTDFSGQLNKIKSLNPDAIVVSAMLEEASKIMVQARALGIPESVRFIGGNGFNSPKVAETAGVAANGAISGSAWDLGSSYPASTAFVAAFKAEYNSAPDQFAAQAYTAAWVAAIAIKNANSVDHAAVRDSLAQLKGFESPLGLFSFDSSRNPVHEAVVLTIKNGNFVVFQP